MFFLRSPRVSLLDALFRRSAFSLMLGTACSCALAQQWSVSPATPPGDGSQATRFVSELLGKMTLEEKLGQMSQIAYQEKDTVSHEERIRKEQAGSFLFVTDPVEINRLQHIAVEETRLHIPLIFGYDVIHGFRDDLSDSAGACFVVGSCRGGACAKHGGKRGEFRRRQVDLCPDGGYCPRPALGTHYGRRWGKILTLARVWPRRRFVDFRVMLLVVQTTFWRA